MLLLRLLCAFFIQFLGAVAPSALNDFRENPFSCTGGAIYFTAHAVDSLLFQNPDLFHDLYVFKCVTTVIFTSGDRGVAGNHYLSRERGLNDAHAWMAGLSRNKWRGQNTTVLIDKYEVQSWSVEDLPNMQILYLRLPDGAPHGHGYDANGGQSLMKLYQRDIENITTVDGNATYTLTELEELVATILHERQPNYILILDHKATVHNEHGAGTDHADHIFSAKLVMDVIEKEDIEVRVQAYAGEFMRKLQSTLDTKLVDFKRKANAFFEYVVHDNNLCRTPTECDESFDDRLKQLDNDFKGKTKDIDEKLKLVAQRVEDRVKHLDVELKYFTQYLKREYYVS